MSPVCSPWTFDETCCDLPEDTDAELIAAKLAEASELLWIGSGRRYGLCEVQARPCLRSCGGGYGIPYPYKDGDGSWRNASCGCRDTCSCTSLCEVILDGPVDSIVEVTVGTETLDESDYRLDRVGDSYRLISLGDCFPSCQDFEAECGAEGAFCVSYMRGMALSDLAIGAVSETTCNLVKACLGLPCLLPKNVASVVRRGVALQFDTAKDWLYALPITGGFLSGVNPYGLASESSVWSPDVPQTRYTTTPSGS